MMFNPQLNTFSDNSSEISYYQGNLTADNFNFGDNLAGFANQTIVISGNGNINYGEGNYDTLDFSSYSEDNIVEYSLAEIDSGGEIVSFGDNERVLDSLTLDNGSQILFEGIDRIVFSDRTIDLTITPDDPLYAEQWNLHMIGVQNAWRFTTGTEDVLLGIQDSGLGVTENQIHPDLRIDHYEGDNIADDFFNNNQGADYGIEDDSHGTSVQGIIAANGDNGIGIAGINWNSEVHQIDINAHNNTGDRNFTEATQTMIDDAEEEQHLIVNLSLSTTGEFTEQIQEMIVTNPNVLFVVTSGNSGQSELSSPGNLALYYDNVIAVGASWGSEDVNGNSVTPGTRIGYEQGWGSQYGEGLTVTAPSEVLTTEALNNGDFGYDAKFNGTSAAAPHASGVASLVWSANPNLTAFEVKDIISETAYDLGEEGYDLEYGHGLINADGAVRQAIASGRDNSNIGDIEEDFNDRWREMLDSFQERFPNIDLSQFYDLYDFDFNSFPGATNLNSNNDPLTGAIRDNFITFNSDSVRVSNFSATDYNPIELHSTEEFGGYDLGVDSTDILNSEAIDIISGVNHDLLASGSFENFYFIEEL
ncbi:MAG: S8 family serine peptidase [Pleurocapsa sp. MO_192.B19]|nr:S8 family serine peptidase [Pleurocapsa sp. MO_192.B19]